MGTQYKIIIREPSGTKAMEEITDFKQLSYTKKRNRAGQLLVGFSPDSRAVNVLGDRYQVEVHRRNVDADLDWYVDFSGLYLLDVDRTLIKPQNFDIYVPGDMVMLSWRRVLWYAATADRSRFDAANAETIMKTLVTYNATSAATTAAGRLKFDGAVIFPGAITVEGDGLRGSVVDWSCAYDNLLETLYDLSQIGGGDYDLVKNANNDGWDFRFYPGQLGEDKTATVIFSADFDNVASAKYERRAAQKVTAVLVGGPNEESAREISSTTSSDHTAENHVETFLNASNFKTDAARVKAGDRKIYETRAVENIDFTVSQTDATRYGVDYELGDLVTRQIFGTSAAVLIDEVTVAKPQNGSETIAIGVITP